MLLRCPHVATSRAHGRVPRRLQLVFPLVADGSRTTAEQAQWQLCGLVVTLLLAALGGGLTGEFQPRALNIYIYISPPKTQRNHQKRRGAVEPTRRSSAGGPLGGRGSSVRAQEDSPPHPQEPSCERRC